MLVKGRSPALQSVSNSGGQQPPAVVQTNTLPSVYAPNTIYHVKNNGTFETLYVDDSQNVSTQALGSLNVIKSPLYFPREILAEENAALGTNQSEWSYANGATGFIGEVFPAGYECYGMSFNADTYSTGSTVTVDLMSYNTPTGDVANIICSISLANETDGGGSENNAYKYVEFVTPFSIPAGVVGFYTRSVTGNVSDARVMGHTRLQVGDYVSDVTLM